MKLYEEGDKSKALCEDCAKVVSTTFCYRDVPFSDGKGVVENILVAVCDHCGRVVSTPPQSTPAIKAAREKAVQPIEAKLPAVFIDALDLACYRIDAASTPEFRKRLLVFYLHQYASGRGSPERLVTLLSSEEIAFRTSKSAPKKRLSLKVSETVAKEISQLMARTRLSRTSLLKSLVLQITDEIVRPETPKHLQQLKAIAAVTGC